MAERLYYENQYLKEFNATVVSCCEENGKYEVILDKTAFFPEGGGQPGDRGFIGVSRVTDTIEKNGEVIHICTEPLKNGEYDCKIDFDFRFLNMQQHSGEHIFSGIVHSVTGFDNVGFHMGESCITVDFNGVITAEQLTRIEKLTNEAIYKNIPIEALYPSHEESEKYSYRSKKEIDGQLRLTKIEGVDLCACCGTHVAFTGEVGIVKVVSVMNYKSGVRVTLQIGRKALEDYCQKNSELHRISTLLKVKTNEAADAVEALLAKQHETKYQLSLIRKELFAEKAKSISGNRVCIFDNGGQAEDARIFSDLLAENCTVAAVFSGDDESGYKYAVTSRSEDVRPISKALNSVLNGRGGGKPDMIQGSVSASKETIENFFAEI